MTLRGFAVVALGYTCQEILEVKSELRQVDLLIVYVGGEVPPAVLECFVPISSHSGLPVHKP